MNRRQIFILLLIWQDPLTKQLESVSSTILGLVVNTDMDRNTTTSFDLQVTFDREYHTICIEDIFECDSCENCDDFESDKAEMISQVSIIETISINKKHCYVFRFSPSFRWTSSPRIPTSPTDTSPPFDTSAPLQ